MDAELKQQVQPSVESPAVRYGVPAAPGAAAALEWWWSVRMANEMSATDMGGMGDMDMTTASTLSAAGFLVAWLAMMLPAITPVVKLRATG